MSALLSSRSVPAPVSVPIVAVASAIGVVGLAYVVPCSVATVAPDLMSSVPTTPPPPGSTTVPALTVRSPKSVPSCVRRSVPGPDFSSRPAATIGPANVASRPARTVTASDASASGGSQSSTEKPYSSQSPPVTAFARKAKSSFTGWNLYDTKLAGRAFW